MGRASKNLHKGMRQGDDTRGLKNFVRQEVEDFKTSKGVKGKVKSLFTSVKQARKYM